MSGPFGERSDPLAKMGKSSPRKFLAQVLTRARELLQMEWVRVPLWVVIGLLFLTLLCLALILNRAPLIVLVRNGRVEVELLPEVLVVHCRASSCQQEDPAYCPSGGCACGKALDGDLSTRWASNWTDDEWIELDFGESVAIDGVVLRWEEAYGKAYVIEVSDDGEAWTSVYTETNGDGGDDELQFPVATTRYVRMRGLRRGTPWGYSLWELEIYRSGNLLSMTPAPSDTACATPAAATSGATPTAAPASVPYDDILVAGAWTALADGDYTMTVSITNECIDLFESAALHMQEEFTESGNLSPPLDQVSEEARADIFSRGVLNNVAACYYIQGLAAEGLKDNAQARAAYAGTLQFPDARVYDMETNCFWSPAQAAEEPLARLQSGSE
jgi:hypothetical protein